MSCTRFQPPRRVVLGGVIALVLAGVQLSAGPAAHAVEAGTLALSPSGPIIANEQIILDGSLPPARSRTVTVQRQVGGAATWTTLRSQKSRADGSFAFALVAPNASTQVRYRVLAPTATIGGTEYPEVETPVVTADHTSQSGWVDTPIRVLLGDTFTLSAGFYPARPGREVVLERKFDTWLWEPVATGTMTADGTTSFSVPAGSVGSTTYRAVAQPHYANSGPGGPAPAYSINKPRVNVIASGDVTPPPVPTNLMASLGAVGPTLQWSTVTATDLNGYRVYRGITELGPWTRLTITALKGGGYTDQTGSADDWYAVTSIDKLGNESARTPALQTS